MTTTTLVKERSKQTVEGIARWSYVSKAILFVSIAIAAYLSALGLDGPDPSRKKVLELLFDSLPGRIGLFFTAITLTGHTVWRLFEVYNDPYERGSGLGGLVYRFTYLMSGISYGFLALTTSKLLLGKSTGPDNQKQIWVAKMLELKGGKWLIVLVGACLLLWAGVQAFKGLSGGVSKALELDGVAAFWRGLIRVCELVGFVTFAGILGAMGWYLVKGAWTENPAWVKNMDDILSSLQELPYGTLYLKGAAVGLLLFGVFLAVMARYFPFKVVK